MALALTSSAATAGTDFSTVVTGFTVDLRQRQLVRGQPRYRLEPIDDTTMRLSASGGALSAGTDTITIETADGLTSSGRTRTSFDIAVAAAGAPPARPSVTTTGGMIGGTVAVTTTPTAMPAGVTYQVRDARSQQVLDVARIGLTLDPATGAVSGTLAVGNGFGAVVIAAVKGGQVVAQSQPLVLYNPPAMPLPRYAWYDNGVWSDAA